MTTKPLLSGFQFTTLPPLSLYVHIPWCVRKCPYCDFNSHELKGELDESAYVDALLKDLELELPLVWGRRVETVFFGGGTPSLFSAEAMDRLLAGLRAMLPLRPDAEITLEANPGTVERGRFAEFRQAGINRLSIGVQSLDDGQLNNLGRIHCAAEARAAAEAAHAAGFDDFNLDLMFGLPGQTVAQAMADLEAAMALGPSHLSWYQLTLEPNTRFYRQPPALPGHDTLWAMTEQGQARLAAAGYRQYEVSAYARDGHRCRHNLNYWRFGDYLGLGAGAHGKITLPAYQAIERRWRVRHPKAFLDHAGSPESLAGSRRLQHQEAIFEFMLNALRLHDGFDAGLFQAHTGLPFFSAVPRLEGLAAKGLVEFQPIPGRVRPTPRGRAFLDDLTAAFLPD